MKNKKLISIILFILVILGLGIYKFNLKNSDIYNRDKTQNNSHDGTYIIDGKSVTLKNGISQTKAIFDSDTKIITKYFGNEVKHDFDGDGSEDYVFIITQETGGSGIFYYVVALLNTAGGPVGSHGVLLGDRIAPQTTSLDENNDRINVVVVNYADRNPGEPMTTKPSLGKSVWLKLDPKTMQFGEVVKNFEGETNPSIMKLDMQTWTLVKTLYNNDTEIKPRTDKKFTLTFDNENKIFSAKTDCNNISGEYSIDKNKILFNKIISTMMYCENSQENDFTKTLNEIENYFFTSKGELIFSLKYDSGSMIFK